MERCRAAVRPAGPPPRLDRDPRQRGGHDPRATGILPATRTSGRDRRRVTGSAGPTSTARPALITIPPRAPYLRRTTQRTNVSCRRLSPAVHPVLSRDEGVLHARTRAPAPGRRRDRQQRSPGGLDEARAGARSDDGGRLPDRAARSVRAAEHADARRQRRRLGGPPARSSARAARTAAGTRPRHRRAPRTAPCAAGASTATMSRRSSG